MRRAALVALLAVVVVGAASAGLPRNLTPPRLSYRVRRADAGSRLHIVSTATSGGGAASASQTTKPVR
jgi:hypothetical protein